MGSIREAEQKQVAPRGPGGANWKYPQYLFLGVQFQGGYGGGPIYEHYAILLGRGRSENEGPKIDWYTPLAGTGAAQVDLAGYLRLEPNPMNNTVVLTALKSVLVVYGPNKGQTYNAGQKIILATGLHGFAEHKGDSVK